MTAFVCEYLKGKKHLVTMYLEFTLRKKHEKKVLICTYFGAVHKLCRLKIGNFLQPPGCLFLVSNAM